MPSQDFHTSGKINSVVSQEVDFCKSQRTSLTSPKGAPPPQRGCHGETGGLGLGKWKYLSRVNKEGCEFHHSASAQMRSTMVLFSRYAFPWRLARQLWWRKFLFLSNLNTHDEWDFFPLWPGPIKTVSLIVRNPREPLTPKCLLNYFH